ncbi:MAG: SIMPL domain-containing protein [Proteobacteria bacterium]|nr:SIMPL domain-containing protein [Desulfobacteraceae bacterium]MBU4002061.1 SIMPL domain-containing protein [Pseudomonadota bacterium]MBU4054274.1 SIMPL domain-containing protein [Pseudomonadota bacterium]MBU4316192.1 SIMPL domain-containing protein [Pseudomonadota bacterium]MBU4471280.1 SIMPL domain-containing protein [Pseudomonadota bacterium]
MQADNSKSSLILGGCILAGLAFLGFFLGSSLIQFKEFERTVSVKGLSEKELPADIALWPVSFMAVSNDVADLYALVEKDTERIIDFLEANGFEKKEISVSSPKIDDKLAQGYEKERIEFRYAANRTITVYTGKVEAARAAMNKLIELGKTGILFTDNTYENSVEYIFTRLNEVKPQMVEEATVSAREVAEKFAKDSKSRLGKIKMASQGQFSIDDRDKNNPHIKTIRVVSTVEYYLSD